MKMRVKRVGWTGMTWRMRQRELTKNVMNLGMRKSGKRGEDHKNLRRAEQDLLVMVELMPIGAGIDLLVIRTVLLTRKAGDDSVIIKHMHLLLPW